MGFTREGTLEDLFEPRFADDVGKAICDAVGDRMLDRVRERTPVAQLPAAYKGDYEEWVSDRGERRPGTLRDKWRRTPVTGTTGSGLRVVVFNPDPVVDHVEYETRPHAIRAHMRAGPNGSYQGSLRFPVGPVFRYAVEVWHPGTQGVHMMRDTEAEIEATWEDDGARVLERFEAVYDERYA